MVKTTKSRRALLSQERCFSCYRKGHTANRCPSKQARPGLANLPVELLEMICFNLNERANMLFVRGMLSLRLTCSSINDKTYQLFGKTAFWARGIRWSSKSLQRFLEVSERAAFAEKVEALYFHASDTGLKREAEQAAADAANQKLSRKQRRQAKSQLWRTKRDQDDKAYLVRTGMDGTLLATALARMPNVRRIMFDCLTVSESQGLLDRRPETARDESTTRTFAVVVSSLAHGNIKPALLKAVRNGVWVNQDEGVSLQALALPLQTLYCFSELRHLELLLETRDGTVRDPTLRHAHAASFLASCPQLHQLNLAFRNDWEDTEQVFACIADKVVLHHLEDLHLQGIRCAGMDLRRFLCANSNLRLLRLQDFDITGSVSFADVLDALAESHNHLKRFSFSQIAQKSFRLYLEQLGDIGEHEMHRNYRADGTQDPEDFTNDYIVVCHHPKYLGVAEDWEGVQGKIRELRTDLRVSDLDYTTEDEIPRLYLWIH
ncbi:hypothetical protein LTR56_024491 [Elasticomyces elasticus]|nr:hypothetical protein LTR56_024491 [Elasticomyces elasticus]KAK3634660.1 hypothetical protein LTR22_019553 [Elasticomyces elasticus]KAK4911348.1 hypothetical protein LTR49_020085 [Elasticomyces elasticus]